MELPTFNCLTDHAPADPVAAGCLRSLTEHGDLATPELEVMELRRVMLERHARYVPVMDGGTLLGVVSFHDVAKAVYEDQSFENQMLKSYIGS